VTLLELAHAVLGVTGSHSEITHEALPVDDPQVRLPDITRAREQLGWEPRTGADEALLELVAGLRDRAGIETPPLAPHTGGPLRLRELVTGVGAREG